MLQHKWKLENPELPTYKCILTGRKLLLLAQYVKYGLQGIMKYVEIQSMLRTIVKKKIQESPDWDHGYSELILELDSMITGISPSRQLEAWMKMNSRNYRPGFTQTLRKLQRKFHALFLKHKILEVFGIMDTLVQASLEKLEMTTLMLS